jgi:hypothetical protein
VSIDPILTEDIEPNAELWVSAVFASDGSIASGPTMHHHIGQVRGWIDQQGEEDARRRISEPPGQDIRSQFTRAGRRFLATSTRAKVIAPFAAVMTFDLPDVVQPSTYEIDIVATFTHVVSTSLTAEPGLNRAALESRIDEDFPHLGIQRGELTDLNWELDGYRERPGLKYRIQPEEDDPREPRPRVEKES